MTGTSLIFVMEDLALQRVLGWPTWPPIIQILGGHHNNPEGIDRPSEHRGISVQENLGLLKMDHDGTIELRSDRLSLVCGTFGHQITLYVA